MDNNGTGIIQVIKDVERTPGTAYLKANFVATRSTVQNRAGYGFHNPGNGGCFLYLESDDNKLHFLSTDGHDYIINVTTNY